MSGVPKNVLDARLMKRLPRERDSPPFVLDVHLRAGSGTTVLLGSSGAGKSLTLNCIAGFARPDEGRILVSDQLYFDATTNVHVRPEQRRCGYIFQDHALFPHMSVRENLRFAASVAHFERVNRLVRHRRVNELLEQFELADLGARTPAQLSGGQRQRAALARVLVGEPRILLLDEPTRGLDNRLRSAFYDVLRQTRERLGIPVILVTHDVDECFELADSVYLLEAGKCLQSGPREAVFARPATVEIARMIGYRNIIPGQISALDPVHNSSRIAALNGIIDFGYLPGHLIGDRGSLCVREHEVTVRAEKLPNRPNQFRVQVESAISVSTGIRIQFEQQLSAVVSDSDYRFLQGNDRLWVEIPAAALHFIG